METDAPLRPEAGGGTGRRIARVALRLAIAGALAVATLEVALRFVGFAPVNEAPYRFSRTKGWELRPEAGEVNALGFRGRDLAAAKPAGTRRIAVLGDSFTYGHGVAPEEAYPAVLETLLREARPGRAVEVVNAGVPGYTTVQEKLHLEERVLPLAPDDVLVGFFLNDADSWNPPRPPPLGPLLFYLRKNSAIVLFRRRLPVLLGWKAPEYQAEMRLYSAPRIGDEREPEWRRCRAALAAMARGCAERRISFRMILWPHLRQLRDYPYRAAHEAVARAAREEGIPLLDLLPLFEGQAPRDLLVSERNPHPNPAAHRRAAEGIAAWIEAR